MNRHRSSTPPPTGERPQRGLRGTSSNGRRHQDPGRQYSPQPQHHHQPQHTYSHPHNPPPHKLVSSNGSSQKENERWRGGGSSSACGMCRTVVCSCTQKSSKPPPDVLAERLQQIDTPAKASKRKRLLDDEAQDRTRIEKRAFHSLRRQWQLHVVCAGIEEEETSGRYYLEKAAISGIYDSYRWYVIHTAEMGLLDHERLSREAIQRARINGLVELSEHRHRSQRLAAECEAEAIRRSRIVLSELEYRRRYSEAFTKQTDIVGYFAEQFQAFFEHASKRISALFEEENDIFDRIKDHYEDATQEQHENRKVREDFVMAEEQARTVGVVAEVQVRHQLLCQEASRRAELQKLLNRQEEERVGVDIQHDSSRATLSTEEEIARSAIASWEAEHQLQVKKLEEEHLVEVEELVGTHWSSFLQLKAFEAEVRSELASLFAEDEECVYQLIEKKQGQREALWEQVLDEKQLHCYDVEETCRRALKKAEQQHVVDLHRWKEEQQAVQKAFISAALGELSVLRNEQLEARHELACVKEEHYQLVVQRLSSQRDEWMVLQGDEARDRAAGQLQESEDRAKIKEHFNSVCSMFEKQLQDFTVKASSLELEHLQGSDAIYGDEHHMRRELKMQARVDLIALGAAQHRRQHNVLLEQERASRHDVMLAEVQMFRDIADDERAARACLDSEQQETHRLECEAMLRDFQSEYKYLCAIELEAFRRVIAEERNGWHDAQERLVKRTREELRERQLQVNTEEERGYDSLANEAALPMGRRSTVNLRATLRQVQGEERKRRTSTSILGALVGLASGAGTEAAAAAKVKEYDTKRELIEATLPGVDTSTMRRCEVDYFYNAIEAAEAWEQLHVSQKNHLLAVEAAQKAKNEKLSARIKQHRAANARLHAEHKDAEAKTEREKQHYKKQYAEKERQIHALKIKATEAEKTGKRLKEDIERTKEQIRANWSTQSRSVPKKHR